MKRGVWFLKIMASVISAAVILVLLLFGNNIPTWLEKLELQTAVTQERSSEEQEETTEISSETESETEETKEVELETEDTELQTTEVESEDETVSESAEETLTDAVSVLPEGAGDPYLSSPLESIVIKASEQENLVSYLLESGELLANDGTGQIRADQIHYTLNQMYQDAEGNLTTDSAHTIKEGFYSAVFTLTDDWNRQTEHTMILIIAEQVNGPILILNTRAVTLKQGESFQYYRYIEKASDPIDGTISERVELEGSVDTSVPGLYQVKFFARNLSGVRSPKATLMVTVE